MINTRPQNQHQGRKPKPSLRIAVDCGCFVPQQQDLQGGIYTVVSNLLQQLGRIDKRNYYLLYSYAPITQEITHRFGKRAKNIVLPKTGFSKWIGLRLRFDKPDVFLATSQYLPSKYPKTLGFIYDLAFIRHPSAYPNAQKLTSQTDRLAAHARHLVTISESTQNDIFQRYHKNFREVTVLYPGYAPDFTSQGPKFVSSKPYFLYVGALKKMKNLPVLLEAFAKFISQVKVDFELVLIGSKKDQDQEIYNTAKRLQILKMIRYLGYVSETDLPKYYRGAYAFVSPSLYEGFGLPILEAMACGTAVVTSNLSSLPEIVEKAGLLVDPNDVDGLAQAMVYLVQNPKKRIQLQKKGVSQAKRFNWTKFSQGVLNIIYRKFI